jgi:hypothetical protein
MPAGISNQYHWRITMSGVRITARLLFSSVLVSLSGQWAFAATDTVTYICVEQKSLGWEPTDSGKERCCEFKPRQKRFFIKFTPAISQEKDGELRLSIIEEVTDDGSMKYQSTSCDGYGLSVFRQGDPNKRREGMLNCLYLDVGNSFAGNDGVVWRFHTELFVKPKAVDYTYSQNLLPDQAYLVRGSCVLSD